MSPKIGSGKTRSRFEFLAGWLLNGSIYFPSLWGQSPTGTGTTGPDNPSVLNFSIAVVMQTLTAGPGRCWVVSVVTCTELKKQKMRSSVWHVSPIQNFLCVLFILETRINCLLSVKLHFDRCPFFRLLRWCSPSCAKIFQPTKN